VTAVVIHTEPLPEGFRWDPTNPVTGTNKFYVRTAEELSKQGLVSVVYDGPVKHHNGVMYITRGGGADALDRERVVIDCNVNRPRRGSRARFQWTSLYNRPTDPCVGDGYDRLFLMSDFHWSVMEPIVKAPVTLLPLGCDFEVVTEPRLMDRPRVCCFTSAPDRGLGFLQSIWSDVLAATGYELATTPYGPGAAEGAVRAVLDTARFWLHPCTGVELYCLSALEAQARGCVPFYVPHMALPETCRYGIQTDFNRFKDDLIVVLNGADANFFASQEDNRRVDIHERPLPTWADTASTILAEIPR
jgi:hypothetical protein